MANTTPNNADEPAVVPLTVESPLDPSDQATLAVTKHEGIYSLSYKCADSGLEFTTDPLDEINILLFKKQANPNEKIPS